MTFSLVARCSQTGQLGVAAMTAMPGVGKLVAHATSGVGVVASQAMMNPYLAYDGLRLLAEGGQAPVVLDHLVESDPGAEGRQVGLVDAQGRAASFTGSLPEDWKGGRTGSDWACQGNRLVGSGVVDAAVEGFLALPDEPLERRLLAALAAGEDEGGDRRGHRSATILVVGEEAYPLWDLRVDDADDPLAEIQALHRSLDRDLRPQIAKLPTREDPLGGFDYEDTADAV